MGSSLTQRDGSRFRAWQATLLAVLLVMALGMVRSGASWGSTAYDATSDPYSMQNMTAADGVQTWWNAGYTGKGVDVAVIDTGVAPVTGLNGRVGATRIPLRPPAVQAVLQALDKMNSSRTPSAR